jgi:predicted acylesterase/phospholipase RssA
MLKQSDKLYRYLNDEVIKLKIKVYTGASIGAVVAGIIVWLVDVAFKAIDQLN